MSFSCLFLAATHQKQRNLRFWTVARQYIAALVALIHIKCLLADARKIDYSVERSRDLRLFFATHDRVRIEEAVHLQQD